MCLPLQIEFPYNGVLWFYLHIPQTLLILPSYPSSTPQPLLHRQPRSSCPDSGSISSQRHGGAKSSLVLDFFLRNPEKAKLYLKALLPSTVTGN